MKIVATEMLYCHNARADSFSIWDKGEIFCGCRCWSAVGWELKPYGSEIGLGPRSWKSCRMGNLGKVAFGPDWRSALGMSIGAFMKIPSMFQNPRHSHRPDSQLAWISDIGPDAHRYAGNVACEQSRPFWNVERIGLGKEDHARQDTTP
jgi:hypothetical protein